MESRAHFMVLLDKYVSNTITAEEHDELFHLIATGEYDQLLEAHFNARAAGDHIPLVEIHPQRAQELMQRILSAEKQTADLLPRASRKKHIARWSIAASLAGIIVLGFLLWPVFQRNLREGVPAKPPVAGLAEKINQTDHNLRLNMEDGSFVNLTPGSKLHYPAHFAADKREVYLDGEAFFEVSKNPDRPFFVYNKNLVTHVLGTSFNVRIDPLKKLVEVSVVTGRVQVYENKNAAGANREKNNGVILTPNQKVIYKEEERQFTATIVSNPLPVAFVKSNTAPRPGDFVFEETTLREVMHALEKTYGLEIVVENEKMYNCLFTGDISRQGLFSKLDIICQSVKASYQVAGTKILVEGKGCD